MVRFCKSRRCLIGKTAIVTGANTGIGYETALEFAKRGCRVILACRNEAKANTAKDKIIKATGNRNIIIKKLDLSIMKSIQEFAQDFITTENQLDILVNNAGALYLPHEITEDGLQLTMATNYFGHFLLTNLLLDLLKKSSPSRIINVSSYVAKFVRNFKVDELNNKAGKFMLYSRTKLCNIYFTRELAKRLEGTQVTVYSLNPGAINTDIVREPSKLSTCFRKTFFLTPEEGAQTTLYLALEDDIEQHNGKHFDDCKPVKFYSSAKDMEKAGKLWEISERLVGLGATKE